MAYKSKTTKTKSMTGSKTLSKGASGKATTSKTSRSPGSSRSGTTSRDTRRRVPRSASKTAGFPSSATQLVGGQLVDIKADPEKAKILQGTQQIMISQGGTLNNADSTAAQDAQNFLHMLGICQNTSMDADFSLIDIQTATEMLANPNIFDTTRERNRQKTFPSGEDKFPVVDDPFYEADETPTAVTSGALEELAKASALEAIVPLAADLASLNLAAAPDATLSELTVAAPAPTDTTSGGVYESPTLSVGKM